MQDTLQDMGVDLKSKDKGPAKDLVQVTADDFDNFDHYNSSKSPKSKGGNNEEEQELNKQRISHISRIE